MKRFIAVFLAFFMIFTLSCPVFASTAEMITASAEAMRGKQIEMDIEGLLETYKVTDNEEEKLLIFNELVEKYTELDDMIYYVSSIAPLSTNFITLESMPVGSNNRVTFTYTVNMAIPNGATVSIGFEYPSNMRQSTVSFIAQRTVGTYSTTPSTAIMCGARYFSKLVVGTYVEKQTYGIFYSGLSSTGAHSGTGRELQLSDITAANILSGLVGIGIGFVVAPFSAQNMVTVAITSAASIFDMTTTACASSYAVGQYLYWEAWIDANAGTIYWKQTRYNSIQKTIVIDTITHSFSFGSYPAN